DDHRIGDRPDLALTKVQEIVWNPELDGGTVREPERNAVDDLTHGEGCDEGVDAHVTDDEAVADADAGGDSEDAGEARDQPCGPRGHQQSCDEPASEGCDTRDTQV